MSYEIQEGYPKLHNVAKEDNALAIQYKSKFNEVNADIAGAQALIDDDPTSEDYNGDLVLNADKLNAICESLDDLQPPFINAKETLAEWMMNFSKEVTEYDSTETYNYGEVVTYQDNTYICINKNVTGAFDTTKWLMITPSDLGFDLTDAEVVDNNGLVEIYLNDEKIAQVTPNLLYLDDEDDAQNGMVYLVQVDGDKYQLRYKDSNGEVIVFDNETNASVSTYESNSIQTELNRLKDFIERSD